MIKQVVILAAGKSSRFYPYNQDGHKSCLNLCGQPIIYWTLDSLKKQGLKEVIVVINPENSRLKQLLREYEVDYKLTLVEQLKPRGQADAIISARKYLADRFLVMDHSQLDADKHVAELSRVEAELVLGVKPTNNPQNYGVVTLKEEERIVELIEKPKHQIKNPYRVFGFWLLSSQFVDYMEGMDQEEYLLETALNKYAKDHEVKAYIYDGETPTLKYAWDLLKLKK